jgi:Peptidase family M23
MMVALAVLLAFQSSAVRPNSVKQGETVRAVTTSPAVRARMGQLTISLFPDPAQPGYRTGLLPVPVDTTTGPHNVEFLDGSGHVVGVDALNVVDAHFREQNIHISKETMAVKPAPGEMEAVHALRDTVSDKRYWQEPFVAPLPGCMTSPFGVKRLYNGEYRGNYHTGLDQRSPAGQPIRAITGGVVRIARMFNIHGGTVGIDHGQGLTSIYLHMSRVAAREGSIVNQGDVIGYVGSTGRSTGPHLHWNLQVNGVPVNPLQWVELKPCTAEVPRRRGRRHS